MIDRHAPLVSAAELEALISHWNAKSPLATDAWMPWRFWYMGLFAAVCALALLLVPHLLAQTLSTDPQEVIRLERLLYLRGWCLWVVWGLGLYSYLKDWYTAMVYSAFLVLGLVNLLFDLITVYPDKLANPSPVFTVLMALRLLAVWCVYLTVRNASRLPDVKDRANILLPFRAKDPL